jgi:hypothetical protein
VPFTMIKRSMVATGAGLLAAALFAKRATRDQRAADAWNQTRLARGVVVGRCRVMLRAPQKVGRRGARGRWQWEAQSSRHPRRQRVQQPSRHSG